MQALRPGDHCGRRGGPGRHARDRACGFAAPPFVAAPHNKEERERVTVTWIAADRLQVDAWDDETAEDVIADDSATVTLAGDTLTLSYAHRRAPTHAQERMPACLFAAKLSFVVSGIARASYRVHVDGHEVVVVDG